MPALTRWHPLEEFAVLQGKMARLFRDAFGRGSLPLLYEEALSGWSYVPPVDVYQTDEQVVFNIEVPGFNERDLAVEVENGVLTVSGERKPEKELTEQKFDRRERTYGKFARSFPLPPAADPAKVEASYANGVLTITMAKRAEAKPKQIKINISKSATGKAA